MPLSLASDPGRDIIGHKAPIDQDLEALIRLEGSEHPITAAQLGERLHQDRADIDEVTGYADMPVFVMVAVHSRPCARPGCCCGRCGDPPIDAVDQIELPGATLDLPYAEPDQQYLAQHNRQGEQNRS